MDAQYCLRPGYQSRTIPEYFDDTKHLHQRVVWQPEVYSFAAHLGRKFGCTHIIDVGCGSAQKVAKLYPQFQIIGLDFGSNIQSCRAQFPYGTWIEHDLDQPGELPSIEREILQHSVIVCSDVIEHLVFPEHLLHLLRTWLDEAPVALLSTPDRDIARGVDNVGPPDNPSHVREWNRPELARLLASSGFRVEFIGLTSSNDVERVKGTTLAVLGNNCLPERRPAPEDFRVASLVIAKNDERLIAAVLSRLIGQGIETYVLDAGSVDGTYEAASSIAGVRVLSGAPADFGHDAFAGSEQPALQAEMIADIVRQINANWLIVQRGHEEIEPPWPENTLRDALYYVDQCGFSRIECTVFPTYPLIPAAHGGNGSSTSSTGVADFAQYDPMLIGEADVFSGATKQTQGNQVVLAEGDLVSSEQERTYPYRFLLKRSALHAAERDVVDQPQLGDINVSAAVIPTNVMPFEADFYQRFLVERLSGLGVRPSVSVVTLEALHQRIERQNRQVAELRSMETELRRWGADQAALIEEQQRTIARQEQALADMHPLRKLGRIVRGRVRFRHGGEGGD